MDGKRELGGRRGANGTDGMYIVGSLHIGYRHSANEDYKPLPFCINAFLEL